MALKRPRKGKKSAKKFKGVRVEKKKAGKRRRLKRLADNGKCCHGRG
jgi:hypothetical protein